MNFRGLFSCFVFITGSSLLLSEVTIAQSLKRLAVVDLDSEVFKPAEKQSYIELVRSRISSKNKFQVLSGSEIENRLSQSNTVRLDTERLNADHLTQKIELDSLLDQARRNYLSSEFEEALPILQNALAKFNSASLSLTSDQVVEVLTLLSACHFFLGQETQSKMYMGTLLDLNAQAQMSSEQFPPALIDLFSSVKAEPRFKLQSWTFDSSEEGFRAFFMGNALEVRGTKPVFNLQLPLEHPVLGHESLVLVKDGFAPLLYTLDTLPPLVKFQSLENKQISTAGLFSPIGSKTPPPALNTIIQRLDVSVVFLGSAAKNSSNTWQVKGQFLESPTRRTSAVIEVENEKINAAVDQMIRELMPYVASDGSILEIPLSPNENISYESETLEKPFYKKWWFWTLAGAGLVGAGVGTYFLVRPGDSYKFGVSGPAN